MVKVKLCGLRRMEDIITVNALLPDYAGFIFAPGRRRVSPEEAAALCEALSPAVRAVGVFVDAPAAQAAETARLCGLAAVQLHGGEDAAYVRALRTALPPGCEVWKAARVRAADDVRTAEETGADKLLLDAYSPAAPGGTGERFDWDLLCGYDFQIPFLLAGGLHEGNVAEAIRALAPFGVDVSSGVETDGVKDAGKMARFIRAAREAGGLLL